MYFTALILGLTGSLHCFGMCSPLAIAVTSLRKPFLFNRLAYNLGRVLTYGILGILISIFGSFFQLSAFQYSLSIALGCVLIVFGITGITAVQIPIVSVAMQKITSWIKNQFTIFLKRKTIFSITLMGMLNGLLPCGLTYLALSYCLTISSAFHSFLFMVIFGASTLPVMLGLTSFFQLFISRFSINLKKLTTIVMIVLGILLISRNVPIHSFVSGQHNPVTPVEEEVTVCP